MTYLIQLPHNEVNVSGDSWLLFVSLTGEKIEGEGARLFRGSPYWNFRNFMFEDYLSVSHGWFVIKYGSSPKGCYKQERG